MLWPAKPICAGSYVIDASMVTSTGADAEIATPRTINEKILQKTVSELAAAVVAEDQQAALKFLRHIVPEYSGAYSDASRQPAPAAAISPVKAADDL